MKDNRLILKDELADQDWEFVDDDEVVCLEDLREECLADWYNMCEHILDDPKTLAFFTEVHNAE